MSLRNFSLNSPEFYEAACGREDRPWIPNGALPREPRWGRRECPVQVLAEDEDDAAAMFAEWQAHLDAGRIGL